MRELLALVRSALQAAQPRLPLHDLTLHLLFPTPRGLTNLSSCCLLLLLFLSSLSRQVDVLKALGAEIYRTPTEVGPALSFDLT